MPGKDIVRFVRYGSFDKEGKIYLPYTFGTQNGAHIGDDTNPDRWISDYGNNEKEYAYTSVPLRQQSAQPDPETARRRRVMAHRRERDIRFIHNLPS